MTRKQLEELGLSKEQTDKIMEINGADIENVKGELKEKVKTLEKDKEELSKQIADRDGQLDTLKNSAGDNEELTKQIAALQTANHTAVPTLASTGAFEKTSSSLVIKVPAALLDEWKAATNWATFADRIVGV